MEKIKYEDTTYEFLTVEELLARKKHYTWADKHLVNNLCNIALQKAGKDFIWAKKHDLEELHLIDIVALTAEQRDELEPLFIDIIKKQLGIGKRQAEREAGWYWFAIGLSTYYPKGQEPEEDGKHHRIYMTEGKYKEFVRRRIKQYEDKHGELKYEDGWENELKAFCDYK